MGVSQLTTLQPAQMAPAEVRQAEMLCRYSCAYNMQNSELDKSLNVP